VTPSDLHFCGLARTATDAQECFASTWSRVPRAQQRNVALDRRRNLARQRLAPDHLRQLVLGQRAATLDEESLQQLLGLDPTEVTRAQALGVDPHLERAEHPHRDHAASSIAPSS